jgi:hypothetical protein
MHVPYDGDFYKKHPLTCDPDDLWGQVRRTVHGQPVPEEQIQMIVDAVVQGLKLESADFVLDLCCGNGALSDRVFAHCSGGLGVDFSPPLIEVAHRRFQRPPHQCFELASVDDWLVREEPTDRFSVAFCYGSFSYLSEEVATLMLREVAFRFPLVRRFFLGNLPDLDQRAVLVGNRPWVPGDERRAETQFGIMRSMREFEELAALTGWKAECTKMPANFFAAAGRFDVVLTRVEHK